MENVKTHICTEHGTIEKLSNFDTIMKDPKDSNVIIGFRDFGGDVETLTLNVLSVCILNDYVIQSIQRKNH